MIQADEECILPCNKILFLRIQSSAGAKLVSQCRIEPGALAFDGSAATTARPRVHPRSWLYSNDRVLLRSRFPSASIRDLLQHVPSTYAFTTPLPLNLPTLYNGSNCIITSGFGAPRFVLCCTCQMPCRPYRCEVNEPSTSEMSCRPYLYIFIISCRACTSKVSSRT